VLLGYELYPNTYAAIAGEVLMFITLAVMFISDLLNIL